MYCIIFIFINGLLNLNIDGKITSLADDTVLLFNNKLLDKLYDKSNEGLSLVKHWLDNNSLQ